ncbi:helix-turn-helix domain-containing protein [Streptacidiphilus fuscans]|uniref:Helix-turn-helix domain-containing protein n=1 Tax=Streptacidiphilus fuscans TaxID=2789292 RepID=A0A931BAM8_9ACTN|nr:helix-turn-helix domain-containing protein [Streptacidiphilus fuscans]MBF9071742.1 helix-turn-helix domain-containing protein [Streptacidiphilus fuscans]
MRHDEHGDQAGGSPIGGHLALWRARRAVSVEELAARTMISPSRLADLEGGRDWVDRRGELAVLAGAMRLDAGDLTGQPYSPADEEHATVRAVAFQLRRELAETGPAPPMGSVEDLDARTARILAAEAAGDEHALALALPGLIRLGDAVAQTAPTAARQRAAELRVRGHVAAAGLLRRVGFRDLAWMLLHRARPGGPEPVSVLAEEARLLIDMGLPEFALSRTERARDIGGDPDLRLLEALANAAAGRREAADRLLRQALGQARDARARSAVSAAYVVVATETASADEVVEHARSADLDALEAAGRSRVLVTAASAHARLGQEDMAAGLLVQAEALAPLRVRLDPFARELLAVLPARTGDPAAAEAVRRIAQRAGVR